MLRLFKKDGSMHNIIYEIHAKIDCSLTILIFSYVKGKRTYHGAHSKDVLSLPSTLEHTTIYYPAQ